MRSFVFGSLLFVAACSSPPPPAPPVASAVTLKVIKLPELERAIASHVGKVVVVDMWAEY
jgi:hypothetical protein